MNIAWQSIPNSSMLYERNINLSFRSKVGGETAIGGSSRDDHVINNSAVQASKEVNDDILRIRLKGNNGIGVIYNSLSKAKDSLFVNQSFIYNGNAFFNEEKVNFVNAGRKGTKILFEADSIDAVILKTDLQNDYLVEKRDDNYQLSIPTKEFLNNPFLGDSRIDDFFMQ
ncbi:MAG: hypothetical protein ACI9DJ_003373 [Algoriphagus sp.]